MSMLATSSFDDTLITNVQSMMLYDNVSEIESLLIETPGLIVAPRFCISGVRNPLF